MTNNIVRFIVWGCAGHAKVLRDVIEAQAGHVIALVDNAPNIQSVLAGVPVLFGEAELDQWLSMQVACDQICAAVAIGGSKGADRHQLAQCLLAKGLSLPTLVHPSASVSPSAKLGRGSQVLAQAVVAADAELGDACIVNNNATIDHECRLGHGVHIAPGATLCGCISVGDYSFVGAGAVILPRVRVGKNVVIGAGAVVTRDVPDKSTVKGSPAR